MSLYSGIRTGLRAGYSWGQVGRDGPNSWNIPSGTSDFDSLGLTAPRGWWNCDEPSGNLAPAIGSVTLTANATGHMYRQNIPGWGLWWLGLDGVTADQSWRTTSSTFDLATGESAAMIALASFTAPASSTRALMSISAATEALLFSSPGGLLRTFHAGVAANGTVGQGGLTTPHWFVWYRNATTNVSGSRSDTDAVTGTHNEGVRTGGVKGLGHCGTIIVPEARIARFGIFVGAAAEQDWAAYIARLRGVA